MSNEEDHFYFPSPCHEYGNNTSDFSFSCNSLAQGFDPNNSYLSFTDCFQGSYSSEYNALERDLGLSPPSWETKAIVGGEVPFTPNSPVLSQLSEDDGSVKGKENILEKDSDDGERISKKENKLKKKFDKKDKEPRFAFMTRSEVDHLEDGYRWRKYGQKAVKNSPFPRSYYRCTTQKCLVKKRVERSNQDSSIVMTTYEGQHNHPTPTTIRGHVAPAKNYGTRTVMSSVYPQQLNDYGLLQDMDRSPMFYAQERQE